jgi:hypothetical protein
VGGEEAYFSGKLPHLLNGFSNGTKELEASLSALQIPFNAFN